MQDAQDSSQERDPLSGAKKDMFRRMTEHDLTDFLVRRPSLDELVKANVVEDTMTWTQVVTSGISPHPRNCHAAELVGEDDEFLYILGYVSYFFLGFFVFFVFFVFFFFFFFFFFLGFFFFFFFLGFLVFLYIFGFFGVFFLKKKQKQTNKQNIHTHNPTNKTHKQTYKQNIHTHKHAQVLN